MNGLIIGIFRAANAEDVVNELGEDTANMLNELSVFAAEEETDMFGAKLLVFENGFAAVSFAPEKSLWWYFNSKEDALKSLSQLS